ncbi:MAG: MFS transporter, partial [Verrucomicrobiota bacterium]|nr:MFS transporter [Verrucomicrobiota bacterium]
TMGAIIGPASAFFLLGIFQQSYSTLFLWTLIPGLSAVAVMAFVVKEKKRKPVSHISFTASLRALPPRFRHLLLAIGLFGLGDFAHTMLILLATQKLTPVLGQAKAASLGIGFYLAHNIFYAGFSYLSGWLADRYEKRKLLSAGYFLAAVMALGIIILPVSIGGLAGIFIAGGIYVALEETVEDSFCAGLVSEEQHGMAFGALATVNGIGDFASSLIVGFLWAQWGTAVAFSYCAILFVAGSWLVWRLKAENEFAGK